MAVSISGTTSSRFDSVRRVFQDTFTKPIANIGASFCVYQGNERVIDLWAGTIDKKSQQPWQAETPAIVFSATKGIASIALLMAHDRGLLDFEAPIAEYWPEFAYGGKGNIKVKDLICHRSGLCAIDKPLSVSDLTTLEGYHDALVSQAPLWEPGSAQGYHLVSFGLYVSHLFYRAVGQRLGDFIKREIAAPLNLNLRLSGEQPMDTEVATIYRATNRQFVTGVLPSLWKKNTVEGRVFRSALKKGTDTQRALSNPSDLGAKGIGNMNTERVRRLELAWFNAVAPARALAKLYGAMAQGGTFKGEGQPTRLMSEKTARIPSADTPYYQDRVLHRKMAFYYGFVREDPCIFGTSKAAFGHPGSGGALGWCDPEKGLSFGYVPNQMNYKIRPDSTRDLVKAVYACI